MRRRGGGEGENGKNKRNILETMTRTKMENNQEREHKKIKKRYKTWIMV